MTLQEILSLEIFSQARVLAGRAGLQRMIKWINIIEILDDISQLQEGEFLVTTAFGIANNTRLQADLVQQLYEKRLCGLAIQTGYYLEQVPDVIIKQAEELAFPVIELPKEISFAAVTKAVMHRLINQQYDLLAFSQDIYKRLTDLVLNNATANQLINMLCGLINHDIAVINPDYELLVSISSQGTANSLAGVDWTATLSTLAGKGILEQLHILKQPLFVSGDNLVCSLVLAPVIAGDEVFGYIAIASEIPLDNLKLIAVDHTATVLALLLTKDKAIEDVQTKLKGDFFDELLHGIYDSPEALAKRAGYLGLNINSAYFVLIVDIDNLESLIENRSEPELLIKNIHKTIRKTVESIYTNTVFKHDGDSIVILLTVHRTAPSPKILAEQIQSSIQKRFPQITVSIGIGSVHQGLSQIAHSYQEARKTVKIIRLIGKQATVASFAEMGIYHFLLDIAKDESMLEQLYNSTVKPLFKYDQSHKSELVTTLRAYLQCGSNAQETSRVLFIHRNTLRYRLGQIAKLTGKDLSQWKDRVELELGLFIAEMYRPLTLK